MKRRYREDGERIIKVRGTYVRRPQAEPEPVGVTMSDALDLIAGLLLLGLIGVAFWLYLAIAWAAS
jgi:ABC-type siderophore export system fused ATPase/permease subunit